MLECNELAKDDEDRTRRSIWPRLALTADKTWMITTPVHYQRRSSQSSVGWLVGWLGSGSLCRFGGGCCCFTSFITYPFLLLLRAIIIIVHLPPRSSDAGATRLLPTMTIIITVINDRREGGQEGFTPLWRSHSLVAHSALDRSQRSSVCSSDRPTDWFTFFSSILSPRLPRRPQLHTSYTHLWPNVVVVECVLNGRNHRGKIDGFCDAHSE